MTEACPHCGAKSGVVPDSPRGHRCVVCGGPRILVEPPIPRAGAEAPLLAEAKALRRRRSGWGIGAGIATALAMIGGVIAVITGSVFDLGALGWAVVTTLALGPALVAGYGFRRVGTLSSEVRRKLEAAEEAVASELVQSRGGRADAAEIAAAMGVTEERAYELLAHAEVAGALSSPAPRRMRVDGAASDEIDPTADTVQMRQRH